MEAFSSFRSYFDIPVAKYSEVVSDPRMSSQDDFFSRLVFSDPAISTSGTVSASISAVLSGCQNHWRETE